AGEDETVRIWNPAAMMELHVLKGHRGAVQVVAWSPDGLALASSCSKCTIRVWDPSSGQQRFAIEFLPSRIPSLAWSANGRTLASCAGTPFVRIWEAGKHVSVLKGHSGSVWRVASSPDGAKLASASEDGTIRIWDLQTGEHLRTIEGHSSP